MNGDAMSINEIKSMVYPTTIWLNKPDTCIVMYHMTPLLYYMERVKKILPPLLRLNSVILQQVLLIACL